MYIVQYTLIDVFIFAAATQPNGVKITPKWVYTVGRVDFSDGPTNPDNCPQRVFPDGNRNPIKFLEGEFGLTTRQAVALMGKYQLSLTSLNLGLSIDGQY